MAHPRRVEPGATYLVTRRCSQRSFRLRPCAEVNRIFLYCLAFACRRTGVLVHAVCVMSNHHHLVVTDPCGVLPDFLRELHRLTAKAMNAFQGQWENLWAAEPCNVVRLVTDDDVDDRIAYTIANPVAAGLVKHPDEWPGIASWGDHSLRVERPKWYFSSEGSCPSHLELTFTRPPIRDRESQDATLWKERVRNVIRDNVLAAHRELKTEGREFFGRKAVMASSFAQRAVSYERKRGVIPTFAARSREVRDELRRIERRFRASYREAFTLWRSGLRSVSFPFGTWQMRVVHAVSVQPPLAA
jgi:REP element-mobilizing transposase RayT